MPQDEPWVSSGAVLGLLGDAQPPAPDTSVHGSFKASGWAAGRLGSHVERSFWSSLVLPGWREVGR